MLKAEKWRRQIVVIAAVQRKMDINKKKAKSFSFLLAAWELLRKELKRTIGQTGHRAERGDTTMSKDSLNECQRKTICFCGCDGENPQSSAIKGRNSEEEVPLREEDGQPEDSVYTAIQQYPTDSIIGTITGSQARESGINFKGNQTPK